MRTAALAARRGALPLDRGLGQVGEGDRAGVADVDLVEAAIDGLQEFLEGDAAADVKVGRGDGFRFVCQFEGGGALVAAAGSFGAFALTLPFTAASAAVAPATTAFAARRLARRLAPAPTRIAQIGAQDLGRDFLLVVGDLEGIDHPVVVGVEHMEEAGRVGPDLSAIQPAIVIGVRPSEPSG